MTKIKKYILYKITNKITGQFYFGVTMRTLEKRWQQHKNRKPNSNYLRTAIKKYGSENFSIKEINTFSNSSEAYKAEVDIIKKNKANLCKYPNGNGYNMSDGGEVGNEGYVPTESHIENLKKSLIGHKKSSTKKMSEAKIGSKNPMFGKKPNENQLAASKRNMTERNPMRGKFGKDNPLYNKKRPQNVIEALKKVRKKTMRPVFKICLITGDVLEEYESTHEACRAVGIKNGVHAVCTGKRKTAGGFYWRFKK